MTCSRQPTARAHPLRPHPRGIEVIGQALPTGAPSTEPPGDAWELLLTRCPDDVQVAVRQVVKYGLGVADVLRALVITTGQPTTTPQPTHEG